MPFDSSTTGGEGGEGRSPAAPGVLDHYSTSQTGVLNHAFNDGLYVVDRRESRDRRMRSAVITSARLLDEDAKGRGKRARVAFITLTYRYVDGWLPTHFSKFIDCVRKWHKRRGIKLRYVFKAELQQRGAVHYHILFWLPPHLALPKPDKQGWWPHGFTFCEWARNPVGYIAKYASKAGGAIPFPKGLRYHGCGGLSARNADVRRWWSMPSWVRAVASIADRPFRAVGGGVCCRATGEHLDSPYEVVSMDRHRVVIMKKEVP